MEACISKTRGMKRVLSEDEDSSPECLLQSEPVTDLYSSDDNLGQHNNRKNLPVHTGDYILKKYTNSSDVPCHIVKYFTYLINEDPLPEICLKESSVEKCLFHAFQFATNTKEEEGVKVLGKSMKEIYEYWKNEKGFSLISEHDKFNFHDLSSEDFYKEMIKVREFIREFDENGEEIEENEVAKYHRGYLQRGLYAKYVDAISDLFEDIYNHDKGKHSADVEDSMVQSEGKSTTAKPSDKMTDKDKRSRLVKIILGCAAEFLPLRGGPKKYLSAGECKRDFPLFVKNADLKEVVEDQECIIVVEPDAVFFQRAKNHKNQTHLSPYVWKLVAEVYDPSSDKAVAAESPICNMTMKPELGISLEQKLGRSSPLQATSKPETTITNATHRVSKSDKENPTHLIVSEENSRNKVQPKIIVGPEPTKTFKKGDILPNASENVISSADYCTYLREIIKASVPQSCCTEHCVDKLAGQHVLQLFAMAHQRMRLREDEGFATGVGLFMVNEFVYFSRLIVPCQTLHYLNTGAAFYDALPVLLKNGRDERPKLTYANFRFDLTLANHRQAFVIFLKEFLYVRKCNKSE